MVDFNPKDHRVQRVAEEIVKEIDNLLEDKELSKEFNFIILTPKNVIKT